MANQLFTFLSLKYLTHENSLCEVAIYGRYEISDGKFRIHFPICREIYQGVASSLIHHQSCPHHPFQYIRFLLQLLLGVFQFFSLQKINKNYNRSLNNKIKAMRRFNSKVVLQSILDLLFAILRFQLWSIRLFQLRISRYMYKFDTIQFFLEILTLKTISQLLFTCITIGCIQLN